MNYYEYNTSNEFIKDSYDLDALMSEVSENGGVITDEYGNTVFTQI